MALINTSQSLGLDEDKKLQAHKHKLKLDNYYESQEEISYRACYRETSKIAKQVWRFLRNCFIKKETPKLYEKQLRPMLSGYL